jgi:hypothetical protein
MAKNPDWIAHRASACSISVSLFSNGTLNGFKGEN